MNVSNVGVNFCDNSNFENNNIHESLNGVDWVFSHNENKCKYSYDDDNDDLLNIGNHVTMNKVFMMIMIINDEEDDLNTTL